MIWGGSFSKPRSWKRNYPSYPMLSTTSDQRISKLKRRRALIVISQVALFYQGLFWKVGGCTLLITFQPLYPCIV